jgi:hypothetical protein
MQFTPATAAPEPPLHVSALAPIHNSSIDKVICIPKCGCAQEIGAGEHSHY